MKDVEINEDEIIIRPDARRENSDWLRTVRDEIKPKEFEELQKKVDEKGVFALSEKEKERYYSLIRNSEANANLRVSEED